MAARILWSSGRSGRVADSAAGLGTSSIGRPSALLSASQARCLSAAAAGPGPSSSFAATGAAGGQTGPRPGVKAMGPWSTLQPRGGRATRPTTAGVARARAAPPGLGPASSRSAASCAAAGVASRSRPGTAATASPPQPRGRERAATAAVSAVARLAGGGAGGPAGPARPPRHARWAIAARSTAGHRAVGLDGGDGVGRGAPPAPDDPDAPVSLPRPTHTRVRSAEYISSAVDLGGCPPPSVPEFALIGRSNVGKSSLINSLTGRKALAQVSKQPGKTRTINHFLINGGGPAPWYLVDLPGYGYARAGARHRLAWASFSQAFFLERPTLASVLLLADGTLPPQAADLECATWLAGAGVPFCVVLTKADKRVKAKGVAPADGGGGARGAGPSASAANAAALADALSAALGGGPPPPMLATSAATGAGRNELLTYIAQLRVLATGGVEQGGGGKGVVTGGAPDDVPDDEWW